jgi:phage terminase large subunit
MYQKTTTLKKIAKLKKRIRACQGGTSSGKTIAINLLLINEAQRDTKPTLTSIVAESLPHLKRGAMRDFLNIMNAHNYFVDANWNKSDFTYTFETGSKIEFFSPDMPAKVKGPRRDRLFINEADRISRETFDQMEVRTKDYIYLDWNPTTEYWFYDIQKERDDVDHCITTYIDNEGLDEQIIKSIEQRRNNKSWWKVYGEGQLGEVEGKIYKDWAIVDELDHHARLERYGIDFGYSNDPTSIVGIYYLNGGYIIDEIAHQKEMSNKEIADTLKNVKPALTIADSAEPKSIDEIKSYGINILPAEKGKDSVCNGIQLVQSQRMSITKRSINVIKEYRNYLWLVDKDGKILNEPDHQYSHSMDAIRYAMSSIIKNPAIVIPKQSKPILAYYPDLGL